MNIYNAEQNERIENNLFIKWREWNHSKTLKTLI